MAPTSPPTVLVTGATGYVGGRLVPCLLREGYTVRCFVRDADRLRTLPWSDEVEIAVGDALDADTVLPALEEVDAVYYLIHSLGSGEKASAERDCRAATNVRAAAETMGVERIVYLGGMRPKGERQSEHLQSRIETGRVLRDGSVPVTEFRAAQIVGSGSLSFEAAVRLALCRTAFSKLCSSSRKGSWVRSTGPSCEGPTRFCSPASSVPSPKERKSEPRGFQGVERGLKKCSRGALPFLFEHRR